MSLQITMIKAPGGVGVSNESHTFSDAGGTIGRGDSNIVVLQDPDRFLSSRHCEIICDARHKYIVDLSTNGTFLNGAAEPLGKGSRAQLSDGDTFEIGDYVFKVAITDGVASISDSPFDDIFSASSQESSSSLDDFLTPGEPVAPREDPFGPAPFDSDSPLVAHNESQDPLAALERLTPREEMSDPFATTISSFEQTEPFGSTEPFAGPTYGDSADALTQAVAWPNASTQNLIPEEWEEELGLDLSPEVDVVAPVKTRSQHSAEPNRAAAQPAAKPQSAEPVVRDSTPAPSDRSTQSTVNKPSPAQVASPTRTAADAKPGDRYANVEEVAGVNSDTAAGSATLLEAMGLDAQSMTQEQINDISEEVGVLMREVIGGLMQVLRSRSSIKNEFRMNVTTIQPVENNPLKFSVDVDEAMANMFVRRGKAYKKPVEAVREGFQEIGEHQLAVIAGIRHGFEQMMKRFDPETMEQNFDRQSGGGVLPGMKKGRYWSSYRNHYQSYTDNMEHSFQHLFGSDFVHAYEDQLRRLKVARKPSSEN